MAGKKKKNLAAKLARMSDEERARYLQRKIEIEEETKKRKEQLISTFMKNKIKKEDAFSRLNLAKINQFWHQILRQIKCREMRENVEHTKKHIDRVLTYKNRTIAKLLEELEMLEDIYSKNFQAHSNHIDRIIESHNGYLSKMQLQYREDLQEMTATMKKEEEEFMKQAEIDEIHLKTIIYGNYVKSKTKLKLFKKNCQDKKDEENSTFRADLAVLKRQRQRISEAIWGQIAVVINFYVQKTDSKRLHLAELRRIDAESATEIAANQERIRNMEDELKMLLKTQKHLTETRESQLKFLTEKLDGHNRNFLNLKQQLKRMIQLDEKQLNFLTMKSNASLEILEKLLKKGTKILNLGESCRKLERVEDRLFQYFPAKPTAPNLEIASPSGILGKCLFNLSKLEGFWRVYNEVYVNFRDLKEEKQVLSRQNAELKGMLRACLEDLALAKNTPSTVLIRNSKSAPIKRAIF